MKRRTDVDRLCQLVEHEPEQKVRKHVAAEQLG